MGDSSKKIRQAGVDRAETRNAGPSKEGHIDDFWRHYCSTQTQRSDKRVLKERPDVKISPDISHSWGQGSSRQTLETLLQKAIPLIKKKCQNRFFDDDGSFAPGSLSKSKLTDCIYDLYVLNKGRKPDIKHQIKQQDYVQQLSKIKMPDDWRRYSGFRERFYRLRNASTDPQRSQGRFIFNVEPYYIPYVLKCILREALKKDSPIFYMKAIESVCEGYEREDTIMVLYYEPRDNTDSLKNTFRSLAQYTRQSHPAMMEPIDPYIQGIAYADQDNQGQSFGMIHTDAIVKAILNLERSRQKITFDLLLREVEQCFRESGIDPENPHLKRMVVETEVSTIIDTDSEEEFYDRGAKYPSHRRNEIVLSGQHPHTDRNYYYRNPGQDYNVGQRPAWQLWEQEAQKLKNVKRRQKAWIDRFPYHMRREAKDFIDRAEARGPNRELLVTAAELSSLNRRKEEYYKTRKGEF